MMSREEIERLLNGIEALISFADDGMDMADRKVADGLTSDLHALLESRLRAYASNYGWIAPASTVVALARLLRASLLSAMGAMDVKVVG